MKNKSYTFNLLLLVLWGILLVAAMIWRAFCPAIILPALDIPLLQAVSLLALLVECRITPDVSRAWGALTLLAAMTFGLLTLCSGFVGGVEAIRLGIAGGMMCLVSAVLFDSMVQRIADAGGTKFASVISVCVLFLAGQCLANVFF